jgi:hypothetical protein
MRVALTHEKMVRIAELIEEGQSRRQQQLAELKVLDDGTMSEDDEIEFLAKLIEEVRERRARIAEAAAGIDESVLDAIYLYDQVVRDLYLKGGNDEQA